MTLQVSAWFHGQTLVLTSVLRTELDFDLSTSVFLDYNHTEKWSQYVQAMVPGIQTLLTLYAHMKVFSCCDKSLLICCPNSTIMLFSTR